MLRDYANVVVFANNACIYEGLWGDMNRETQNMCKNACYVFKLDEVDNDGVQFMFVKVE